MTTVTWGNLENSATDPEKIAEAIDRKIAEHEADPEAHLGAGESLQNHKADDVVDHPAGSILIDKLSLDEDIQELNFESLSAFTTSGSPSVSDGPGLKLYIETGAVASCLCYSVVKNGGNWLDFSKDILFQFVAWSGMSSNYKAYFCLGGYSSVENHQGLGFRFVAGEVKGYLRDNTTTHFTADFSISNLVSHVYRVQWVASEKTAYFFVDGVQKASIVITTLDSAFEPNIYFRANTNGTIDGTVYIRRVKISRGQ